MTVCKQHNNDDNCYLFLTLSRTVRAAGAAAQEGTWEEGQGGWLWKGMWLRGLLRAAGGLLLSTPSAVVSCFVLKEEKNEFRRLYNTVCALQIVLL
jgi:hypothetical protein